MYANVEHSFALYHARDFFSLSPDGYVRLCIMLHLVCCNVNARSFCFCSFVFGVVVSDVAAYISKCILDMGGRSEGSRAFMPYLAYALFPFFIIFLFVGIVLLLSFFCAICRLAEGDRAPRV